MFSPSDKLYQLTKEIKQGRTHLKAPFDEMAKWISEKWSVSVLNVAYRRPSKHFRPRLHIVVERDRQERVFYTRLDDFKVAKERAILRKFQDVVGEVDGGSSRFEQKNLGISCFSFERIALMESNWLVPEAEINALKRRIGNPDLWRIKRTFYGAQFFFYTDAQVAKYESLGKRKEYARAYFEILKPYDEFDYIKPKGFDTPFDSKQNLDENYEGSWFYYSRDH